jgi:hypothetical protein
MMITDLLKTIGKLKLGHVVSVVGTAIHAPRLVGLAFGMEP